MEQENNADRRFTSFLQALERLSERYGVLIQSKKLIKLHT